MSTFHDPETIRALELSLQAGREPLDAADRAWLDGYLAGHPEVAAEARSMRGFADTFRKARLPVREEFRESLRDHLEELVRAEVLAQPPVRTSLGPVRRFLRFLLGDGVRPPGVSPRTLILARSLAVYLGIAAVVCAFLLLREPRARGAPRSGPESVRNGPGIPTPAPSLPDRKRPR